MKRSTATLLVLLILFSWAGLDANRFRVDSVTLSDLIAPVAPALAGYRIAVVSDPHLTGSESSWADWRTVLNSVNAEQPDFVFVLGDFSYQTLRGPALAGFQARFAASLAVLERAPYLVLGNHETWGGRAGWQAALVGAGVTVLENRAVATLAPKPLCIVGIGDAYTGHAQQPTANPSCSGLPVIHITHDPAAMFTLALPGVWLAGHTHCGQVKLPWLPPLVAPTRAPKRAQCGVYTAPGQLLFVSSGVGNSVLPLRFFAGSQVELLHF